MLSDEDRSVSRGEYFVSGVLSSDNHNSYFTQSKIMPKETLQYYNVIVSRKEIKLASKIYLDKQTIPY